MCGIVGIWQKKPINSKVLQAMTSIMVHRGPDDEGIFIDKNIGLGHRRLAIIDLTASGHQPMFNQNKTLAIVYNGEIYNFQNIKKRLQKKGYRFNSTSDTEVILCAYEEWGPDCVKEFNGMWAFAIYDLKQKKIFISRDRLGIKPLYYYAKNDKLIFASEIKAILKYPEVKAKLNYNALGEYFTFQNILSNETLFEDIYLLEAGYNLTYDGKKIIKTQYWQPDFSKERQSAAKWQEKIKETLQKSIWRHLIADVPVGTMLSGGMDSGTIAYFASQKIKPLITFTGGFDLTTAGGMEINFDERREAEIIARTISSEHYENVLHGGSLERVMPKLIWHLEDLRLGMSYPQYYLAKLASAFVKVGLSGSGGDEFFGGYPWRYKIIKNIKNNDIFNQKYYQYWSRLIKDKDKDNFFNKKTLKKIDLSKSYREYLKVIAPAENFSPIDKALYFEQKTFLHGFFIVEDKLFMAHSMELRVPFTDLEIITLANKIPDNLKVKDNLGKLILRRAMRKILPEKISQKIKTGFTPPEGSYYRHESFEYVKKTLLSGKSTINNYFEPITIRKIVNEHISGKNDHRLLIWSFLCFEMWNRIFLEGKGRMYESRD